MADKLRKVFFMTKIHVYVHIYMYTCTCIPLHKYVYSNVY